MISLLRLVSPFSLYVHLEHHTSRISQRTIFLAVLLEIPLFMVLLYGSCIFYVDQEFDISHHCVLQNVLSGKTGCVNRLATCVITTLNVHHCTGVTSVHLYRYVVFTVHIRQVTTAHVIQVSELCTQQNKCHKTIKH